MSTTGEPAVPNPPAAPTDPKPPEPPKDPDVVLSVEKHRALLDEKKKAQKRAEEAEAKLAQIEEDKLKASGDLQKIIDAEKAKNATLTQELDGERTVKKNARKLNAFLKAAGPGLDDKWFSLVDLDAIQFKADSDELDSLTVAAQVETFKKSWPEAFKPPGNLPPANPPNGTPGKITQAEFAKLKAKDMAKYKPSDILD